MRSPFSNEVLDATLDAVRARRRRRKRAGRVAAAGMVLAVALGFVLIPKERNEGQQVAEASPVLETPKTVKETPPTRPTITVFTTEQVAPTVNRISDAQLDELLEGRKHGLVMMADGRRKLWVPDS